MKGQIIIKTMTPEECAGQIDGVSGDDICGVCVETEMVCTGYEKLEIVRSLTQALEMTMTDLLALFAYLLSDTDRKRKEVTLYGPNHGKTPAPTD